MNFLRHLGGLRGVGWYIGLLGAAFSLAFALCIYPAIGDYHHAVLDPDLHGPLGFGIWKNHSFSYYPNTEPSSARGPLYPLLIAATLAVSGGWWPASVQWVQCGLFGLTCVMVFWTAKALWNAQLAVLAAGLCAIDPFLIWYTSRIWVEPLMMFLFTALIAGVVKFKQGPTRGAALLVGLIVGLSVMAKSVYTPFLVLLPLLLLLPFGKRVSPLLALLVLLSGVLVVMPWTIRNGLLTGVFAPEVGNTGFTLHQGNDFVEDFNRAPFSVSALYPLSVARMREEEDVVFTPGSSELQKHVQLDDARRRTAIQKLVHSPSFFIKKITFDLMLFWTFGDTAGKSLAVALFQLPLLAVFCAFLVTRRSELKGTVGICVCLIALYYFAHLPTIALARYSVVLVPGMLAVAVGIFAPRGLTRLRT